MAGELEAYLGPQAAAAVAFDLDCSPKDGFVCPYLVDYLPTRTSCEPLCFEISGLDAFQQALFLTFLPGILVLESFGNDLNGRAWEGQSRFHFFRVKSVSGCSPELRSLFDQD